MKMATKLPMPNPLIEQKVKALIEAMDNNPSFYRSDFLRQALLSLYNQGQMDALGKVEEYASSNWYAQREVAGVVEYTGSPVGVLGVDKFLSHIAYLKEKAHAQIQP